MTFVSYVHWRLNLLSVTLATFGLWAAYRLVRRLTGRVRSGEINPDELSGRFARPRRWCYRLASALPLVGVPRPEFRALAGVNLEIGRGMFGLLGPNGAGKTTLMRILCRVLEPSYGSILIDGRNILNRESIHGLIGYLPQHFGNYGHLSAYEYLEYRALLEGYKDRKTRDARVIESLEQVNLIERKDDPVGSFSGGMKQRLGIAQTLLHTPLIVVVDEPTAGLDPLERIRFRNLLARLSQDRIVIFLHAHRGRYLGKLQPAGGTGPGASSVYGNAGGDEESGGGPGVGRRSGLAGALLPKWKTKLKLISHQRTPDGVRMRFLSERAPAGIRRAEPGPDPGRRVSVPAWRRGGTTVLNWRELLLTTWRLYRLSCRIIFYRKLMFMGIGVLVYYAAYVRIRHLASRTRGSASRGHSMFWSKFPASPSPSI